MRFEWSDKKDELERFANGGGLAPEDDQCWIQYHTIQSELNNLDRFVHPNANVSEQANLIGPVHVASGAQILPGAQIEGPTYIGQNALIGTWSVVRSGSFIASNSIIGNHCHCVELVVGPDTGIFHHNGISRSIIGAECQITIFVATGSTRPDDEPIVSDPAPADIEEIKKRGSIIKSGTYISPHVFIMPNISIGKNSAIGPFVQLSNNVEPNTYIKADIPTKKRENKLADVEIDKPPNYPFEDEFK